MKKQIQILKYETKKSKAGRDYRVCECIVHSEDGDLKVGQLMVFKPELPTEPGTYVAEFNISVDYDRRVGAELVSLKLVPNASVARAADKVAVTA